MAIGVEPVKHKFPLRQRDTKGPPYAQGLRLWKVLREITRYPLSAMLEPLQEWSSTMVGRSFVLTRLFYKRVEIEDIL